MDVSKMKIIGEGSWSTAYEQDEKTVIIHSYDPAKRVMSSRDFPKHRMFPTIKYIGEDPDIGEFGEEYTYYKMQRVNILSKCNPKKVLNVRQHRFFNALQAIPWTESYDESCKSIASLPSEFSRERDVIREGLDTIHSKHGEVSIEFQAFNLAHKNGQVILLDVFYPNC